MNKDWILISDKLPEGKLNSVEFELIGAVVENDYIYEDDIYPIGCKILKGGYDTFNQSFYILTGLWNRRDWELNEVKQWRYSD